MSFRVLRESYRCSEESCGSHVRRYGKSSSPAENTELNFQKQRKCCGSRLDHCGNRPRRCIHLYKYCTTYVERCGSVAVTAEAKFGAEAYSDHVTRVWKYKHDSTKASFLLLSHTCPRIDDADGRFEYRRVRICNGINHLPRRTFVRCEGMWITGRIRAAEGLNRLLWFEISGTPSFVTSCVS